MDDGYLVICERKFPNAKMRSKEMAWADLKRRYCFSCWTRISYLAWKEKGDNI